MPADISGTPGSPADRTSTVRRVPLRYTGPTGYVSGGDAFVAQDAHLGWIDTINTGIASNGTTYYLLRYVPATERIMWFTDAGVEVAAFTALSAFTGDIEVIGH